MWSIYPLLLVCQPIHLAFKSLDDILTQVWCIYPALLICFKIQNTTSVSVTSIPILIAQGTHACMHIHSWLWEQAPLLAHLSKNSTSLQSATLSPLPSIECSLIVCAPHTSRLRLLLDADLARPTMHELCSLPPNPSSSASPSHNNIGPGLASFPY